MTISRSSLFAGTRGCDRHTRETSYWIISAPNGCLGDEGAQILKNNTDIECEMRHLSSYLDIRKIRTQQPSSSPSAQEVVRQERDSAEGVASASQRGD